MTKGGSLSPLPLAHSTVVVALPRDSQRLPSVTHYYYSTKQNLFKGAPSDLFCLSEEASPEVLSADGNFKNRRSGCPHPDAHQSSLSALDNVALLRIASGWGHPDLRKSIV